MSWKDGLIEIGSGTRVGEGHILSWQDSKPMGVVLLSFSTYYNTPGVWEFDQIYGEY